MREAVHVWGQGVHGKSLYLFRICCEHETALNKETKRLNMVLHFMVQLHISLLNGIFCNRFRNY